MTWFERAACRGMDTRMFFPERGESCAEALTVCRSCEVANQCLDYCLSLPKVNGCTSTPGIWGGTTGYGRNKAGFRSEFRKGKAA